MDASLPAIGSRQLPASSWEKLTEISPEIKMFQPDASWASPELEAKFTEFVAGSFFKAMLSAMRKTVGKQTIMHGGRAEEIFRNQLDDTLANRLALHGGSGFSEKLFRQFLLQHQPSASATTTGDRTDNAYRQSDSSSIGSDRDITV